MYDLIFAIGLTLCIVAAAHRLGVWVTDRRAARQEAEREADERQVTRWEWVEAARTAVITFPAGRPMPQPGDRSPMGRRFRMVGHRLTPDGRVSVMYEPFDYRADCRRRWAAWKPKRKTPCWC